MWITTVRNWKSAQPSPTHPPPANSNNELTHLGALFSFSFSLKYSITFFSQSGLTPFWAEKKKYTFQSWRYISLGCLIGSAAQDTRSCRVGGWILQSGWGRAPVGSQVLTVSRELFHSERWGPQTQQHRNHRLKGTLLLENILIQI